MMIFGFIGLLTLGIGLLVGIYVAYLRFSGQLTPGRPLITFAILLILGGIQILSFGFMPFRLFLSGKRFFGSKRKTWNTKEILRNSGTHEKVRNKKREKIIYGNREFRNGIRT